MPPCRHALKGDFSYDACWGETFGTRPVSYGPEFVVSPAVDFSARCNSASQFIAGANLREGDFPELAGMGDDILEVS
jgi:hypothetical protein